MPQVITMVEKMFDGKYKPAFLLDHSPIHKARPSDALNPRRMNCKDGGAQPLQRNGWYRVGDNVIEQPMVYQVLKTWFPNIFI